MAFDREKALAAGYSKEEIDAYLQGQPQQRQPSAPVSVGGDTPPPPSTVIPEIDRTAERVGMLAPAAGAILKGAAEYAVPAAGVYGLYKGGQLMNMGRQALETMSGKTAALEESNRIARMNAERLANRPGFGGTPGAAGTPGSPLVNAAGRPMAPPAAPPAAPVMAPPAAAPAPAAAPSMLNRMVSAAAPYARFAGGAGMALTPGSLNTGEQQQLAQMQSPESVAETQRNRQAIAAAGRQPTSSADLDRMIRDAAAKRALMMGQQGR